MGAVISMDGSRATRRQLFDIGIAGPLAGLVVIIPVLIYGLKFNSIYDVPVAHPLGRPMLVQWLINWLHPTLGVSTLNPWLTAGWVGCLITGLNMFPLSQLDGGHVAYCLFRRDAHKLSRLVTMGCIAAMIWTNNYTWAFMLILVIMMGIQHPRTANDREPLGLTRRIIGIASLSIPVLCFISQPVILK
jgi:membrane-associated protease RseP (regulator of RpoE activity)